MVSLAEGTRAAAKATKKILNMMRHVFILSIFIFSLWFYGKLTYESNRPLRHDPARAKTLFLIDKTLFSNPPTAHPVLPKLNPAFAA